MKQIRVVLCLAAVALCLEPCIAAANTAVPELTYEQTIIGCSQQIAQWNRQANWQETLIICVIVFGGVIAVFQSAKLQGAKTVALVLGGATSVLTGINAKGFSADYGTLRRAAVKGQAVVNDLNTIVSIINESHPTGRQLDEDNAQFAKNIEEFNSISTGLAGAVVGQIAAASSSIFRIPGVLAQSATTTAAPSWMTQIPSSSTSLYYVGEATASTLAAAQSASLKNALAQAIQDISQQVPDSSAGEIQSLVDGSYAVKDTSLQYDKQSGAYTFYTLVSISKLVLSLGRPTPHIYQQSGWAPADLTSEGSMVIALDTDGGVSSIQADSQGSHINLLFRLPGALKGAAVAADANYVYATANSPLGCTVVRYTQQSRSTDQRLIAVHKRCFGIATDGSTLYVDIPDDRAILYSRSWTSNPSAWTVSTTGALLTMVYDRFGQRLLTADIDGNAYSVSTSNGGLQTLTHGLGYVESLAVSDQYIIAASGRKLLFRNRSDNKGINPPSGIGSMPGGSLVGVAVDQAGGLWIADGDKKLVEGPFLLN
jgi:hypothetical protein